MGAGTSREWNTAQVVNLKNVGDEDQPQEESLDLCVL